MLFKELYAEHFGKFHKKKFCFHSGLNVIYGENEAGKSTMHSFLRGMLFGIEKTRGRASKDDLYTKYQPWDSPGAFQGSIVFEQEGKQYRLSRSFYLKEKYCTLTDLGTGRSQELPEGRITELFPTLTESSYRNTVSVEQLRAKTESDLAAEVQNYITNLSLSKSNEVDVTKALDALISKRKALEAELPENQLIETQRTIDDCLEKEKRLDELTIVERGILKKGRELEQRKQILFEKETDSLCANAGQFPMMQEKYSSLLDFMEQENELREKQAELSKRLEEAEMSISRLPSLQEERFVYEEQRQRLEEIEDSIHKFQFTMDRKAPKTRLKSSYFFAVGAVVILLCTILYNAWMIGILIGLPFLLIGFGMELFLHFRVQTERRGKENQLQELELLASKEEEVLWSLLETMEENSLEEQEAECRRLEKLEVSLQHWIEQRSEYLEKLDLLLDRQEDHAKNLLGFLKRYYKHDKLKIGLLQWRKESSVQERKAMAERILEYFNELRNTTDSVQSEINDEQKAVYSEEKECSLRLERIRWEIQSFEGNEESLLESKERQETLLQKKKNLELEIASIELAIQTIKELAAEIHDSFGRNLNEMLSSLIHKVTDGKYSRVVVDEKLNIKVMEDSTNISVDKLSVGTIEQIYLALRLSVAELFYPNDTMPLLLDDTFAYYDESRLKSALSYLLQMDRQILLFTCHKREAKILDEIGALYHYVNLSVLESQEVYGKREEAKK